MSRGPLATTVTEEALRRIAATTSESAPAAASTVIGSGSHISFGYRARGRRAGYSISILR
jgi:hypothetical protein